MDYRVSIVDDNASDREYIAALVKRWAKEAGHTVSLSAFPSAEAVLFAYEDSRSDMLLLDIEMGGLNGIELAKEVRQKDGQCSLSLLPAILILLQRAMKCPLCIIL